jgi:A/G-specific adenine glycosylase
MHSPYAVLLSEVLLKRTTSTAAASLYCEFLAAFPNMNALAQADASTLEQMLKRIGLQIQRTNALKDIARYVSEHFDGTIPQSREELEKIPHVGHYTAAALRSFGFGIPDAVVDSNVMRILQRLFAKGIGRRKLSFSAYSELAMILLPQEHQTHNFAMLDLGALVCRYDRPRCRICPLTRVCDTGVRLATT